jgi:hypothetical protein
MVRPLLWFSAGLLATAITFIFAYHTQLRLYYEEREMADGKPVKRRHEIGVWLGTLPLLFAAVAFGIGCWTAGSAINKASRETWRATARETEPRVRTHAGMGERAQL